MKENWLRLDHAAKIFPAGTYGTETQVFRFSCELYEPIDAGILQEALDRTIKAFPSYRVVLRHGFFWYYLEESSLCPVVKPEMKKVCQDMECVKKQKLLFEVTYFQKRINLEIYHVLSDGTSAMHFLKNLTGEYLSLKYGLEWKETELDASYSQRADDSYARYYSGEKVKRVTPKAACRIHGVRYSGKFLRNISGRVGLDGLMSLCRSQNATMTVFLAACLIYAIGENVSVKERKKPIVLSVPVNLRNAFPSASARNFFGAVYVEYDWQQYGGDFQQILAHVKKQFKEKITREHLAWQMDSQSGAEHNIFARMAPLFLKNMVLRRIYKRNMKGVTATVSNVGAVEMPEEFGPYIRAFEICSSTNKIQACICSFHNCVSISCTTPYISSDIERVFFRKLSEYGIHAEIMTNFRED